MLNATKSNRLTRWYVGILTAVCLLLMARWLTQAAAKEKPPAGGKWWPSEWGAGDQRGAANRMTPQKVLEATGLIHAGKVYQLGRLYEHGMPLPGKRHFSLTIPGSPTYGPSGKNKTVAFDEIFSGEIGQIGTQLDGLGHFGARIGDEDYFYNGFKRSEFAKPYGFEKLGVENIGVFFTRGLLLDVARLRKVERLQPGYAISPQELQACLEGAGLKIREGDVVLVRTGHGLLWMKDNKTFETGEPGLGVDAAKWLTSQKVTLIGCDNWAIEVVPHEDRELNFPVHEWIITRNGVYNLENLDLEELARDKVTEFAFVFAPLRLKGATGSPGNPIAVR